MSATSGSYHENLMAYEKLPSISNRKFGITFAIFFLFIALIPLIHGDPLRIWAVTTSAIIALTVALAPQILTPVNAVWTALGKVLHKITSPVLLAFLFFAVFTPIGLIARLVGHDPLRLKKNTNLKTYWVTKKQMMPPAEAMKQQF